MIRRALAPVAAALLLFACDSDPTFTSHADEGADTTDTGGSGKDTTTVPDSDTSTTTTDPDSTAPPSDTTEPGTDTDVDPGCQCDDGNECTTDTCEGGACVHTPRAAAVCAPVIEVTAPARGASFLGGDPIEITGTVTSPTASTLTLTLNDSAIPVNPNGAFTAALYPSHGINVFELTAVDGAGNRTREVRAAIAGGSFFPTLEGPKPDALVPQGLVAWLGAEVWDDDDTSDLDDFATLASVVLDNLDFTSLVGSALAGSGTDPEFGWCAWTVTIGKIDFKMGPVDLVPTNGGLNLSATVKELVVSFSATAPGFACPDAIGTLTVPTVTADASLGIALKPDGTIQADVLDVQVEIVEPTVDITEGFASLLDWAFNWFNGTFANLIESAVESAVTDVFAPALQEALNGFASYETSFALEEVPVIGTGLSLTVGVAPTQLTITPAGARLGLGMRVTAPKGVPAGISALGAIARGDCLGTSEVVAITLPTHSPVALGIHDDVLNQVLFAGFWGGTLHATVDGKVLSEQLGLDQFDVQEVRLNPLLPPVITSCSTGGALMVEVGDLGVSVDVTLNGQTGTIDAFVSAAVKVELGAAQSVEGGKLDLSVGVKEVSNLGFQVIDASGSLDGSESLIDLVLGEVVTDLVGGAIGDGFVKSFPIPSFDLGALVPGIPLGTVLGFSPASLGLESGYTVMTGGLSE